MNSCRPFLHPRHACGTDGSKMPKSIPALSAFGGQCGILPGGKKVRDVNDLATI